MNRLCLLSLVLVFAFTVVNGYAQDEPVPAERIARLQPLYGEWVAESPLPDLPPGELLLQVRPILSNNFLQLDGSYHLRDGEVFELFRITVASAPEEKGLQYRGLHFDGQEAGEVSVDGGKTIFTGEGMRFVGGPISSATVYERDGKRLIVNLETKQGDKVDERRIVMQLREEDSSTDSSAQQELRSTSEQLAKELQGTWRLEQQNGRYTVKTVTGQSGKLTRYDAEGNVRHAHESEFELSEHNGVRFFHLKKLTITEGPDKGMVVPAAFLDGYIYKIEGDTLIEAQGLKTGGRKARTFRWNRVKDFDE